MTHTEAKRLYQETGNMQRAAAIAHMRASTFRSLVRGEIAQHVPATGRRVDAQPRPIAVEGAKGGFSLEGKRVLASKPTDVWKARFYALRRGMGYRLETLAEEWANSADTVRAKARAMGALRYIEDPEKPGEYIACAVHPETPKGK